MNTSPTINNILGKKSTAQVVVHTLGSFEVWVEGSKLGAKDWKRDKATQLFQFLLMARNRKALHKEQIMDKLWEDDVDDQGFKVALHSINKALEPAKKSHSEAKYIERIGLTYKLLTEEIYIDSMAFEALISIGNKAMTTDQDTAIMAYKSALEMHKGQFLPDRIYEDWSADERERLQLMFLGASVSLAELLLDQNPIESIQICQEALLVDVTFEEAYRIQMAAFFKKGNRPMAIKTYMVCEKILWEEMAVKPLPETKNLHKKILAAE